MHKKRLLNASPANPSPERWVQFERSPMASRKHSWLAGPLEDESSRQAHSCQTCLSECAPAPPPPGHTGNMEHTPPELASAALSRQSLCLPLSPTDSLAQSDNSPALQNARFSGRFPEALTRVGGASEPPPQGSELALFS